MALRFSRLRMYKKLNKKTKRKIIYIICYMYVGRDIL